MKKSTPVYFSTTFSSLTIAKASSWQVQFELLEIAMIPACSFTSPLLCRRVTEAMEASPCNLQPPNLFPMPGCVITSPRLYPRRRAIGNDAHFLVSPTRLLHRNCGVYLTDYCTPCQWHIGERDTVTVVIVTRYSLLLYSWLWQSEMGRRFPIKRPSIQTRTIGLEEMCAVRKLYPPPHSLLRE